MKLCGETGCFLAPGMPVGSLTPDHSPHSNCRVSHSLTGQGIFSGLPGGAILLTQWATQHGPDPNLSLSQGSACLQIARTHHHPEFSHCHSTHHNPGFKESLGSNYLHKGDQKKGVVSSLSLRCHFAKAMQWISIKRNICSHVVW